MTWPDQRDPYWKLRPPPAKPDDEFCRCADRPPIVLQDHLSENPLACLKCNGEVPPERTGFTAELAEKIAFWRNLHDALMHLWLDSGDYEKWATTQLEDPGGQLNVTGLELVEALNKYHRTYYWWFQDNSTDEFEPRTDCPRCFADLVPCMTHLVCDRCSIVVPNG